MPDREKIARVIRRAGFELLALAVERDDVDAVIRLSPVVESSAKRARGLRPSRRTFADMRDIAAEEALRSLYEAA